MDAASGGLAAPARAGHSTYLFGNPNQESTFTFLGMFTGDGGSVPFVVLGPATMTDVEYSTTPTPACVGGKLIRERSGITHVATVDGAAAGEIADSTTVPGAVRLGSFTVFRAEHAGHLLGLSVLRPNIRSMTRYVDEDLAGAEFRECDLTGARLIGVVMQDAVIDGLITNLVVNGVEVTGYVEAELDRRHPVRVLIRSEDPADLREATRRLHANWATTIERIRRTPGVERRSVNDEWSAAATMRHLVFVHDSWFRRCCLGSTELFTPMGIGTTVEPYRGTHGLDLSLDPALDEIVSVREAQAAELEAWLDEATTAQLAAPAPVPDDDVWPPYARGRSVRRCLGTVLNETFEHHGFCVRDLDLIEAQDAKLAAG